MLEGPVSKWPVSNRKRMASSSFRVVSCELERDRDSDAGGTKRQEDRRGTLAVKSGPPTRASGGVADSVRPLRVDDSGPPMRRPRSYYRPDPPRVERHSAWHALFVVAGRLLGPSRGQGPSLPGHRRLTYAGWEVPWESRGCPLPGGNRRRRTHWP